jgi:hypothetical protein
MVGAARVDDHVPAAGEHAVLLSASLAECPFLDGGRR